MIGHGAQNAQRKCIFRELSRITWGSIAGPSNVQAASTRKAWLSKTPRGHGDAGAASEPGEGGLSYGQAIKKVEFPDLLGKMIFLASHQGMVAGGRVMPRLRLR
jgi:hypothetical protein